MIEESFRSGKYPLTQESEKQKSQLVKVINRSDSEDMKGDNIVIETRITDFFVMNNYVSEITHLPGMIEMDALDSFKMLSRRIDRVKNDLSNITIKKGK
ncbi:hypothetical protein NMY3_03438 [Candidatus Nitrosocosmicus oleophilus]|uniref:Uncharacterized protein n=1 Tax=Candidatus Nitrosocosmicus oleophilus TaxID=1353260 RepID=A0A654M4Q8_9ARCH|nr:hypothetical protein [Candidatus Nitrosocosmicus oleophilus]ALI37621.1 hypothetical protein NMY3_03438 [Candidatus Nitrosocosmicus oleophilus]